MDKLLKILKENAKESPEDIGRMLGLAPDKVREEIKSLEEKGVIRGYQAIVNEDGLDFNRVTAIIEVKLTPEREGGFNKIAKRVAKFDEVRSVHLISGAFDLLLFVEGATLHSVASFVSEKLSTIDGVVSTATHFMLKTYKHHGVLMSGEDEDGRLKVSP